MKNIIMNAVLFVLALSGLCSISYADTLRLAYTGIAKASIVIPNSATVAEEFAAQELKAHLDKITGGNFSIVRAGRSNQIHVGRTDFAIPFAVGLGTEDFTT